MGLFRKNKLTADIEKRILPLLYDSGMAEEKLYALVTQDTDISERKGGFFIADPAGMKQQRRCSCLALFAMERNFAKRDPKIKLLMEKGALSPVVWDFILNSEVPAPCCHFCGRDHEVERLHELLNAHGKVFVQGIPGIGKSELVKAYAKEFKKEMTNAVYFTYSGSLQRDIMNLDFANDFPSEGDMKRLMKHHKFLKILWKDSLLIVDNFDTTAEKDSFLPAVLRYRMKVIFTTRSQFEDVTVLNLTEMEDEESLFQLAAKLYTGAEKDREIVREIIRTVHGHTLAVELAARLLETGLLEPAVILRKLQEERTGMDAPDTIGITKDGKKKKATYYQHIRTLFELYKRTEAEQNVLRGLTLAPLTGISARLFAGWMHLSSLNVVNDLVEKGFVQMKPGRLAALHPMIREVAIEETKPDITNCRTMMESIQEVCIRHGEEVLYAAPMFDVIENIMKVCRKDDLNAYMLFLENAFVYMEKYGENDRMKRILQEMADYVTNGKVTAPRDCALIYDYCSIYEEDREKALEWSRKAVELADEIADENPLLAANMHQNLGGRYRMAGQREQARAEMETSIRLLRDNGLTEGHDFLAQMVNYAMLMTDYGEMDKALKLLSEAERRTVEAEGPMSQDYAVCMEAKGHVYLMMGDGEKAAKYYLAMFNVIALCFPNQPAVLEEKKALVMKLYMQAGMVPPSRLMEKF